MRFAPLVLVVVVLSAACGDGPTPPTPTPEPTADGTVAPVPGLPVLGPAPQDLEFIGPVSGFMSEASVTCAWFRSGTPGGDRFQMALDGLVGSERHRLRVVINGYTGPGPYAWDGVPGSGPEVTAELDSTYRGHVVINVDQPGGSGDMEITLTSPLQGRIHGIWECPGTPR
jgi:hypothetical protein